MQKNLFVMYDLVSPGQSYDKVVAAIQSLGGARRVLESTWYVTSSYGAAPAADIVWGAMDGNDKLLVVDAQNNLFECRGEIPKTVAAYLELHWDD